MECRCKVKETKQSIVFLLNLPVVVPNRPAGEFVERSLVMCTGCRQEGDLPKTWFSPKGYFRQRVIPQSSWAKRVPSERFEFVVVQKAYV